MIALKAAALMAAALVAAFAMRRTSAAARHGMLATALIFATLMPLLVRIAPGWSLWFAEPPSPADRAAPAGDWPVWLWLAGAAIGCARVALESLRLKLAAARATNAAIPAWTAAAEALSNDFGLSRHVTLLEIDRPTMPVTWGVWRPKVLLPRAAREWPSERVRAVIAHELAHVRRFGWAIQLAAELATAFYWFNPLAWALGRRLRLESERACDDAVLCAGMSGAEYASHLVDVARAVRRDRAAWRAAAAIARRTSLERRVAAAVDDSLDRTPPMAVAGVLTTVLIGAFATAAAGLGEPTHSAARRQPVVTPIERELMMRFGGVEKRLSVVAGDVAFRRDRLAGRVVVQARLGLDGWPTAVRVVEPAHPDLAIAAEDIMRQWHREPARLRGVPVEVPIRMTIDFREAP